MAAFWGEKQTQGQCKGLAPSYMTTPKMLLESSRSGQCESGRPVALAAPDLLAGCVGWRENSPPLECQPNQDCELVSH